MVFRPKFPGPRRLAAGACLAGWLLLGAGCGPDESPAPAALPPEKAVSGMQKAFSDAPAPLRTDVEAALRSLQESRPQEAVARLNQLTEHPGLTPEQRQVAGRTLQTALEQLRAAAARGDAQSQEALEQYRASK